jgi:hypothetical protein
MADVKRRVKRPSLHFSRSYYWLVVLCGVAGGYCYLDDAVGCRRGH